MQGAGGVTGVWGAGGVTMPHRRCAGRVAPVTDPRQREQTMNRLKKRATNQMAQTNQVFAQSSCTVLMPFMCNYL